MGCHSKKRLSVHARIDSPGYCRLLWESNEEEDKGSHAAIFEVKFGKKAKGSFPDSRERTTDTLFIDWESTASVVEGSDFKDNFVPTADCIRDTKERQLVTRSSLQRLRCCVCHLHPEQAITASGSVWKIFQTVLQQVYNFKVDVIAGDANAAAHKFDKRQEYQDLHNSSVAVVMREMQREVNMGRPFESRLHINYNANYHFSQLRSGGDLDCCFIAILSWRKPPGPRIMRNLWSNSREQTQ